MYYFKPGWEPPPHITEDMAKQLLIAAFNQDAQNPSSAPFAPLQGFLPPPPEPPPEPPSSDQSIQALHIGHYVQHMMNDLNYTLLDLTITKDTDGNLIFEVVNKEK